MDADSDDDQLMLVPAALQSGHTTPSRLSQTSQETTAMSHSAYIVTEPSNGGWDAELQSNGLQAFPRPRSSIEDSDGLGAEGSSVAVDSRIERRKRNQYKRHGSLTLAWQQQKQQAEESKHAANYYSEALLSSDMYFDGSPMTMPVVSYPRNVYQKNVSSQRHSVTDQYEQPKNTQRTRLSGAHSAIAAVTGSRIMTRLRSNSLVSSRSNKGLRSEARHSGSRLRFSNDGSELNCHQSSNTSGLFAPVNSYRASSSSSGIFRASFDYSRSGISSRDNVSSATYVPDAGSRISKNRGSAQRSAPMGMSLDTANCTAEKPPDMRGSQIELLSECASSGCSDDRDKPDAEAVNGPGKEYSPDTLLLSPLGKSASKTAAEDNANMIKPFADKGVSSSRTEWLEGTGSIVAPTAHSSRSSGHCDKTVWPSNCPGTNSTEEALTDSPYSSSRGAALSLCGDGGSYRPNISVRAAEASKLDESHAHSGNVGDQSSNCTFAAANVSGVGVSRGRSSNSSTCAQQLDGSSSSAADCDRQSVEDVSSRTGYSYACLAGKSTELRQFGGSASGCLLPHQNLAPQHYSQEQPLSAFSSSSFSSHFASSVSDIATSIAPAFTFTAISPPELPQEQHIPAYSIGPFGAGTKQSNDFPLSEISETPLDSVENISEQISKYDKRCRRARLVSNPPTFPLPQLPAADMSADTSAPTSMPSNFSEASLHPINNCSEQIPNSAPESATQTAINTAACTPVASSTRASAAATDTSGDFTKVGDDRKQTAVSAAYQNNTIHSSPTHFVLRNHKSMSELKQRCPEPTSEPTAKPSLTEPAAHLQGTEGCESGDMYANSSVCDRQLHNNGVSLNAADDRCAGNESDLTRHPTLVFDQSPFFRASALINVPVSSIQTASTLDEHAIMDTECPNDEYVEPNEFESGVSCVPIPANAASTFNIHTNSIDECRASEERAHELGVEYVPSKSAAGKTSEPIKHSETSYARQNTLAELSKPRPRPAAAPTQQQSSSKPDSAEGPFCRNSLFPNVVKQQSRCLSVLLQHGPHGGIRRIGPLLITRERGGVAIANLNPAFVDMMDVQPVDNETAAFLKRANIRRRSFSTNPLDPSGDWLKAMPNGSNSGVKKAAPAPSSSGPGMWWPLNDDNCSDEVIYEVHVASSSGNDAASAQASVERMGSSTSLANSGSKPTSAVGAPRKGSVSSQLRMMVRADSSSSVSGGHMRSNLSQSSLVSPNNGPLLARSVSDTSDISSSGYNGKTSLPGHNLADVTMKTEGGTITRSIKCISLRLLVNRLASPEGNVDSDLMTDFLNSYRFFAHPIDVMRLIIIRYMNCFAVSAEDGDYSDTGDAEDADDDGDDNDDGECKFLTINGWRKTERHASNRKSGEESRRASTRFLPPLARNDGAIVQLRVMNIIKYWIKFHPHDFRLHHRLTRLLLLFLSHIQKQPGRAEFVNSIRQKLSSGKLLAVETPSFAGPPAVSSLPATAVQSQTPSIRNSAIRANGLETARSAIDLQAVGTQKAHTELKDNAAHGPQAAAATAAGQLTSSVSASNLQSSQQRMASSSVAKMGAGNSAALGAGRTQHTKKGSTSYFRSLFQHRSKSNANANDTSGSGSDSEALIGYNGQSVRISQRGEPVKTISELPFISGKDNAEQSAVQPSGNMYASDFGLVVMEALAKSGVPTPQTPVGRTLLNYTIANRNPYRVNMVGIDPATFAEQLTLLEHELFARISATEFSLKGRVGNLETILHTMQGMTPDTRSGQTAANPVPNLTAMTSWFNQATYWAVLSVLSEPTAAARALVIKQLIHIAFHCLARRNYYGAFELAIALDNSAVRRLHETWQLIPPLMKDIVSRILKVLQSRMNFRTYRESVKAAMVGASGPDEDMFNEVLEQIKALRAKDLILTSHAPTSQSSNASTGGTGLGNLVHGALFGTGGDDTGKHHSRKKSSAHSGGSAGGGTTAKESAPAMLTEQDCACITYAIRIRAASFAFTDPNAGASAGVTGYGHSSVPVSSKGGRGSGAHLSSSSSRSNLSSNVNTSGNPAGDSNESRSRRARSTSNSNGVAGGRSGSSTAFKQGRMITDGMPLPLVPFVAVHMTDLLHADEANSTYSEEHQKMRSRNPTGPDSEANLNSLHPLGAAAALANKRHLRCDSAAISNVNQAQPLINMQKFRLITAMLRELHLAQRTKYPYMADKMLQQQIHSAVRNIKAQTNDIFNVVEEVAMEDPILARPPTAYAPPFGRSRAGSNASRQAEAIESEDQMFGYPLYQIAALQKSQDGASLVDASMEWDCTDIKDNQELEQRLYMLSKWVEPVSNTR
ncbi:hypothetical protein IWW36_000311 [Coemansia brasiliensis]|uniref:Ras-GEF domain-containing protein n=1 Tax=Coemansia brasiliensis TaxID=2650707 RepID=A0A9W8M037_9FUNG|nr:hypothetical protein IWW36_000311 [Coemansia brasiliensis]